VAPDFIRAYCRGVTALWAGLLAACAVAIAGLALAGSAQSWQAVTGWGIYALMLGVCAIEFSGKTWFRYYYHGGPSASWSFYSRRTTPSRVAVRRKHPALPRGGGAARSRGRVSRRGFGLWCSLECGDCCDRQGSWGHLAHWPIALAMFFRSYQPGSTPMGGEHAFRSWFPAGRARRPRAQLRLQIQALGMSSAVLYPARRQKEGLPGACCVCAARLPAGDADRRHWLAPRVPELGEACLRGGLGQLRWITLLRLRRALRADRMGIRGRARAGGRPARGGDRRQPDRVGRRGRRRHAALQRAGAALSRGRPDRHPDGGRADGFTSLVAIATRALQQRSILALAPSSRGGGALAAAAPIRCWAALGALAVSLIPRTGTLALVAVLCLAQLVWICAQARLSPGGVAGVAMAVLGLAGALQLLRARGAARPTPGLL
jgi:hypothetical protein